MTKNRTSLAMSRHHTLHRPGQRSPVDWLFWITAVGQPLLTLPQVIVIFSQHTAHNVSLATWVGYEIFTCIWLLYALLRHLRPLILTECLWLTLQGAVIIGILRYG